MSESTAIINPHHRYQSLLDLHLDCPQSPPTPEHHQPPPPKKAKKSVSFAVDQPEPKCELYYVGNELYYVGNDYGPTSTVTISSHIHVAFEYPAGYTGNSVIEMDVVTLCGYIAQRNTEMVLEFFYRVSEETKMVSKYCTKLYGMTLWDYATSISWHDGAKLLKKNFNCSL